MKESREVLSFATQAEWERWLRKNHVSSSGVWLKLAKKASGHASIDYAQALEGALIWGWIDGQKDKHDTEWWLQRFTRRGPRSNWSKVNRTKVDALTKAGRMQPAGLREIERAKEDGRWDAATDSPATATVPPDLEAMLARNRKAKAFFETLNSANRYAILYRVQTAKKAETRAARIEKFVAMLAKGEKLHP